MANTLESNVVTQTTPFLTQRLQFNCDTLGSLLGADFDDRVELALVGVQPDEFYYTFCNGLNEENAGAGPFTLSGNVALNFVPPVAPPGEPIGLLPIYEGDVPSQVGGTCVVVWLKWYPQAQGGLETFEPAQTSP